MCCNKQNRVKEVNSSEEYTATRECQWYGIMEKALISFPGTSAQLGALSDVLVNKCIQHREPSRWVRGLNAVSEQQYLIWIAVMSWHSSHMRVLQLMDTGYRQFSGDRVGGEELTFFERAAVMHGALPWEIWDLVEGLWIRKNILLK